MTEGRTRPILHLKLGARPAALDNIPGGPGDVRPAPKPPSAFSGRSSRPAPPPKVVEPKWKCRPCGAAFPLPAVADEEAVRCPACNAKLGLAADFRADPPNTEKLRARLLVPRAT